VTDLTDERLREIAAGKPIPLAVCAATGDPSWAEVRKIAAELLAARNSLQRLRAIEAAARVFDEAYCEPWDKYQALRAALAAKETAK
jgi:hypothetical protein